MKGFFYLIEISITAVLVLFSFITMFSMTNIKENWERYDMLSYSNMISSLSSYEILNYSVIKSIFPEIYDFDISVYGIPPNEIEVGCINCNDNDYENIKSWLSSIFINGRLINFTIFQVTSEQINNFDVVVFINKNNFDYETNPDIVDYLIKDKPLIAITKPSINMLNNFSLEQQTTSPSGRPHLVYNLSNGKTPKYFLGLGINVSTLNSVTCPKELTGICKNGIWNYEFISSDRRNYYLNNFSIYTNSSHIVIQKINTTIPLGIPDGDEPFFYISNPLKENDTFIIKFKLNDFTFKIKKIDKNFVIIQPLNNTFKFPKIFNSTDENGNCFFGNKNNNLLVYDNNCAAAVRNGNKIWIAAPLIGKENYPEFSSFLKAAVLSLVQNYEIKHSTSQMKKYTTLTFFKSLCCDIPETFKVVLKIWYKF
ncbi:MAG: hypothetical protein QXX01_00990 [Candidatus Aenigmatarchaeota archaeon]